MKKISLLTLIAFILNLNLSSQTIPSPQAVPYSQSFSTLVSTSTTYPSGWQGWKIGSSSGSTFKTVAPVADEAMIASGSASSTAGGVYNYNGKIGMLASGSIDPSVAFALNLTGYTNSKVTVDISTIRNPYDGSTNTRYNNVELQCRVGGTSGAFTSLGSVYRNITTTQTGSGVTTPQNLKTVTINLPTSCDNQAVVQLRWVQRDSIGAGARPSFAFDNISVTGTSTQTVGFFRTKQSGNWNNVSTWEASADNSTWVNAVVAPKYTASTITIQSGHTVNFAATDTIDQVTVDGKLTYADIAGSTLRINNGSGTDLIVNGTFEDFGPLNIDWVTGSRWSMGSNGNLIRSRSTSSDNWRDHYEGGIVNIPSNANWILRKLSNDNPSLTSTGNMYYPNLIIENNTGALWTTANSSSFTGSVSSPVIKGNFDIGGNGTNNVSFINNNTNASAVLVSGNFTLKSGSTLRNQGTGFEMQGDLTVNGSIDNSIANAKLVLSGGNNQNISGTSTITLKNIELNKSNLSATVTLQNPVTVSGTFTFTNGYLISSASNPLIFDNSVTVSGAGNNSFVNGILEKIGNTAFTFPIGKNGNYQPLSISAPSDASATYTAEYFHADAGLGNNKDATIDSVSNCEYWSLSNLGTAYPVNVSLGWNSQSCRVAPLAADMRLVHWSGTKWIDLGNSSLIDGFATSETAINNFGTFTLGQEFKCIPNNNNISNNAINLQSDSLLNQTTCDSIAWYSFIANGFYDNFLIKSDSTNQFIIKEGQVYTGTPGSLSLTQFLSFPINSGDVRVYTDYMNAGQTYFLKLKTANNNTCTTCEHYADFNIYKLTAPPPVVNASCNNQASCQLVCNSDLEQSTCSPSGPSAGGTISCISNWTSATSQASPDYFSGTGTNKYNVPDEILDNVNAHSGNAFVGLGCSSSGFVVDSREYMATKLSCKIIKGQTYTVSFWYLLPKGSQNGLTELDVLFYNGAVQLQNGYTVISQPAVSQLVRFIKNGSPTTKGGFMANTWTLVTGTFTATDNFDNLCLGNLQNDANTTLIKNPQFSFLNPYPAYVCYYFFEDVTVVQNNMLPLALVTNPVCTGQIASISVVDGNPDVTYTWTNGSTTVSGIGMFNFTYTPSATETWTVTASTDCCTLTAQAAITVTVNPNPTITVTSDINPVCANSQVTLTANGALIYAWLPGPSYGNTLTTSLTSTTTFTVSGIDANGCSGETTFTETVLPLPQLSISPTFYACVGVPVAMTISNTPQSGVSYVWSPLPSGNSNPTSSVTLTSSTAGTTIYTVTATNINTGCRVMATTVLTVTNFPVVTIQSSTICSGNTLALVANGGAFGSTYVWNTGGTTATINVNPTTTTVYSATITTNGCSSSGSGTVTVIPSPLPVTVNPPNICPGYCPTISVTNYQTDVDYSWSTGATSTAAIVVCPTVTTTYTVTATSLYNGCSVQAYPVVNVLPNPVVTVTSQTICTGGSATLTASGASFYTWNTGAHTATITVSPTVTTTYSVTGSINPIGCSSSATATVTVNPLPVINVPSQSICLGATAILTASGANTYSWNPGGATTSSISVTPTVTTNYTVTGSDGNACTNTVVATVTVNPIPNVTVTNPSVCLGSPATITASGASSYVWSTGELTPSITVNVGSTATFTVIGISGAGCEKSATATVTVKGLPAKPQIIGGSENICASSTSETYFVTPLSGATYSWSVSQTLGNSTSAYAFTGSGSQIHVNWSNVTSGYDGVICLNETASNGCSASSCYTVAACCATPTGAITLNNSTLTATYSAANVTTTPVAAGNYKNQTLNYTTPVEIGTGTNPVFIYNTLTLGHGQFTIANTDVTLGQDARILCLSGCSLTITRASHLHGCEKMWNNIDAQPGSHVEIIGGAKIEDAIMAVAVNNNASIIANGAFFNKNKVGIWIGGHTTGGTGDVSISQCIFSCRAIPYSAAYFSTWTSYLATTIKGNNFIPNNIVGTSGVEVLGNTIPFTIGSTAATGPGGTIGTTNTFDNLSRGIVNQASTVNVYNNLFQNIHTTNTNNAEACVRIYGGSGTTKTNVGNGNTNGLNTFKTSIRGVWEVGKGTLTIDKNAFTNVQQQSASSTSSVGILFEQWGSGTSTVNPVLIQNNAFSNSLNFTNTAVLGLNNTQVYATITKNTISNSSILLGTVGIRLEESSSGNSVRYQVTNNVSIQGVTTGIICNNLSGAFMTGSTLNYGVNIEGNKIINRPNNTGTGFNVRITGCTGVQVNDNNLKGTNVSSGNVADIGVYVGNSTSTLIKCNIIDGTGVPVKVDGSSCVPGSVHILGNNLKNGTYGLFLDNAANIGHIEYVDNVGNTSSSDNLWGTFSSGFYSETRTGANAGNYKIKYRNTAISPSLYIPSGTFHTFLGTALPALAWTPTLPAIDLTCNAPPIAFGGGNSGNGNVNGIKDFITNAITYPVNDPQYKYIGKKDLYATMKKGIIDPSLDSSFGIFMTASSSTSIGQLLNTDSLMQNGIQNNDTSVLIQAESLNNNLIPATNVEQNHKDINNLYLKYHKNDTLEKSDIIKLQGMAALCPFTDGNAVYQARALLLPFDTIEYLNPCEIAFSQTVNRMATFDPKSEEAKDEQIIVYPNPTEAKLFIAAKSRDNSIIEFNLFDAMGNLRIRKSANLNNGIAEFDLNELPSGVYFYKIISGDSILKEAKLIIVR